MSLRDSIHALWEKAEKDAPTGARTVVGINPETWRFWKANAGNAKARRRWRRRMLRQAYHGEPPRP